MITDEVIVVDNGSQDGSVAMLRKIKQPFFHLIELPNNLGYGKANNIGLAQANGKYILYLNSDILLDNVDFVDLISYLEAHAEVGGLTVRVNLPEGGIDPASHRGFPTIWRSFCYFSKLEALTFKIPYLNGIFGGYHLASCSLDTIHQIDAPTGAFFLVRKTILDKLEGFDEDFFMYGEDLDLAYRIRNLNYSIVYYPSQSVTHLKSKSGLQNKKSKTRNSTRRHFYESMKIFYDKHYASSHSFLTNIIIHSIISLKQKFS